MGGFGGYLTLKWGAIIIIIFIRHEGRNGIKNIKELRTIKLSLKQ